MDDAGKLFGKWQGWLKQELHDQFQRIAHDHIIYLDFLSSINPYVGGSDDVEVDWGDVAAWIGSNYYTAVSVAIRRMDDRGADVISLRRLLVDMKQNACILTEENVVTYNPFMKAQVGGSHATWNDIAKVLDRHIELLDQYGAEVRKFVNKNIAHLDIKAGKFVPPKLRVVENAVKVYHNLYRTWALWIAGMSCQIDDPNMRDLLPMEDVDYKEPFTRMWRPEGANGA